MTGPSSSARSLLAAALATILADLAGSAAAETRVATMLADLAGDESARWTLRVAAVTSLGALASRSAREGEAQELTE